MMTVRYTVEIHGDDAAGWGASVPDLHVFATAATREGVLREIRSAAQWHIEGLITWGDPVPLPTGSVAAAPVVEVAVPA